LALFGHAFRSRPKPRSVESTRTYIHLASDCSDACNIFSRNVSAKVSALNSLRSSARPCRPRFSFFCIQFSKNRPWDKNPPPKITSSLSAKQIQPSGQTRKRTILMRSHNLVTRTARSTRSQANQPNHRAHSATASGAPPSLCRYIDPAPQNCQHRF